MKRIVFPEDIKFAEVGGVFMTFITPNDLKKAAEFLIENRCCFTYKANKITIHNAAFNLARWHDSDKKWDFIVLSVFDGEAIEY